jgi:hypothetical protein
MKKKHILILALIVFSVLSIYTIIKIISNQGNNTDLQNEQSVEYEKSKIASVVRDIPEVREWMALFTDDGKSPITGGSPILEILGYDDGVYTVHLYERMSDRVVTFNWLYIDPSTKKISDLIGNEYQSDNWWGI